MTEPSTDPVIDNQTERVDHKLSPQPDSTASTSQVTVDESVVAEPPKEAEEADPKSAEEADLKSAEEVIAKENQEPTSTSTTLPPDSDTLFSDYINTFKERMQVLGGDETVVNANCSKLEDIHQQLKTKNPSFLKSNQFIKLMELNTREAKEINDMRRLAIQNKDLTLELNRLTLTDKTSKPKKKIKNKKQKIKELTEAIKRAQREIIRAENEEIDLNSMNTKTSYTDLPKLYKKVNELWYKREELLNRSTNTGRSLFKKYYCSLTTYPDINKCVEQLFNNHLKRLKTRKSKGYVDESFTFIDVRKAVLDEIADKNLIVSNAETMITTIYEELVKEMKARRQQDSEETLEALETLEDLAPEVFVSDDPELEKELASNKCSYKEKLDELVDKYATEDKQKNGETLLPEGLPEWESGSIEDTEEFESIDVKDGDLEEDEEEKEEEQSDDDLIFEPAPIPDFTVSGSADSEQPVQDKNSEAEAKPSDEQTSGERKNSPQKPKQSPSKAMQSPPDASQTSSKSRSPSKSLSPSKSTSAAVMSSRSPSTSVSIPERSSQSSSVETSPTITPMSSAPQSPAPSNDNAAVNEQSEDEGQSDVIDISDSDDEPDSTTDANQVNGNTNGDQSDIEVIDLFDSELNPDDEEADEESSEQFFTIDRTPMTSTQNHSPVKRRAAPTEKESPVPHKQKPNPIEAEGDCSETQKTSVNDSSVEIIELD